MSTAESSTSAQMRLLHKHNTSPPVRHPATNDPKFRSNLQEFQDRMSKLGPNGRHLTTRLAALCGKSARQLRVEFGELYKDVNQKAKHGGCKVREAVSFIREYVTQHGDQPAPGGRALRRGTSTVGPHLNSGHHFVPHITRITQLAYLARESQRCAGGSGADVAERQVPGIVLPLPEGVEFSSDEGEVLSPVISTELSSTTGSWHTPRVTCTSPTCGAEPGGGGQMQQSGVQLGGLRNDPRDPQPSATSNVNHESELFIGEPTIKQQYRNATIRAAVREQMEEERQRSKEGTLQNESSLELRLASILNKIQQKINNDSQGAQFRYYSTQDSIKARPDTSAPDVAPHPNLDCLTTSTAPVYEFVEPSNECTASDGRAQDIVHTAAHPHIESVTPKGKCDHVAASARHITPDQLSATRAEMSDLQTSRSADDTTHSIGVTSVHVVNHGRASDQGTRAPPRLPALSLDARGVDAQYADVSCDMDADVEDMIRIGGCPITGPDGWMAHLCSSKRWYFYPVESDIAQWDVPEEWYDHTVHGYVLVTNQYNESAYFNVCDYSLNQSPAKTPRAVQSAFKGWKLSQVPTPEETPDTPGTIPPSPKCHVMYIHEASGVQSLASPVTLATEASVEAASKPLSCTASFEVYQKDKMLRYGGGTGQYGFDLTVDIMEKYQELKGEGGGGVDESQNLNQL